MSSEENKLNFWEHLDVLRVAIIKILVIWSIFSIIAFILKEQVFNLILAPESSDFITYRWINNFCTYLGLNTPSTFKIQLINTGLAQQFIIHIKASLCMGILLVTPFVLYEIFSFVSPALYSNEKKYTLSIIISGYIMFIFGVILSYLIIFPLTFQFLGTYQVADNVVNLISLESYISTMIIMCISLGIVCELPVIAWLFSKMGLLSSSFMCSYRKHAIVIILTIAAIITPTSDIFTLMMVSLPIWVLYEAGIIIVKRVEQRRESSNPIQDAIGDPSL